MLNDVVFAWRAVARRPVLAATIVLVMALGIGANAVVFAILKAAILDALPYREPDRLVAIVAGGEGSTARDDVGSATAAEWISRARSLDALEVWGDAGVRVTIAGATEMVRGMRVTAGYLDLLGARMQLGRSFTPDDETPAGGEALILTDAAWRDLFGADPLVVGRTLAAIGGAYRIVGVLGPDFRTLHMSNPGEFPRLYIPLGYDVARRPCRECPNVHVIGRLARGVRVGEAQAEMRAIAEALAREHPADYADGVAPRVLPLRDHVIGRFGAEMSVAQAVAAIFLLLACASVAALLVAHGGQRRAELALRAALGADRRRIVRQLAVESLLVAAGGGLLGVAIAWVAMGIVVRTAAAEIPRLQEMSPDVSMLIFGVAASIATGLLFGLAPAMRAARVDLNTALKASGGAGASNSTAMNALVTVEVTVAFVLVLAVCVLGKSYARLLNVDAGFEARRVLTLSLMPDGVHYGSAERRLGYYDAVAGRARRIPDVETVGCASTVPLSHPDARRLFILERPVAFDAAAPMVDAYLASPEYFRALGIPIRRGRAFTIDDRRGGAPVALISESTARAFFGGGDPIGRHIQIGEREAGGGWAAIVGIVGDVRQYGLDVAAAPAAYLPFAQAPNVQGWSTLVVRARVDAERVEPAVRGALAEVDPTQPQFHVQPMEAYVSKSVAQRTFTLALVAACGAAAFLLATLGVYSVVSYVVGARRREAAIRIALGAAPAHVVRRAAAWIGTLVGCGIALGLGIAALAAPSVAPLLFQVPVLDPQAIAAVSAIVMTAALAAAYVPARRAARADPMLALRSE